MVHRQGRQSQLSCQQRHSVVQVVRRHCSSYRRLGFIGTDGRTRHFIVQTGQHWHGSTGSAEERMMQLLRLVNNILEKHPQSRTRRLASHAPIIVPVYSQVRLLPRWHPIKLVQGTIQRQ